MSTFENLPSTKLLDQARVSNSSSEPATLKRKKALQNQKPRKKLAKSRATTNRSKAERTQISDDPGVNEGFAFMDGRLLSDYLAQRTRQFERHLSAVELEDKHIPEKAFPDTTCWEKPRDLDNITSYLESFSQRSSAVAKLAWAPSARGTPHTIVITGAGLRAAHLARALRKFRTEDAAVAKLFAKHIKLKDAQQFVKTSRIGIAVGTPRRIVDLVEAGALSVDKLERIVVDSSHMDPKKRCIFDMSETFIPLIEFLSRPELKVRYGASSERLDLLIY